MPELLTKFLSHAIKSSVKKNTGSANLTSPWFNPFKMIYGFINPKNANYTLIVNTFCDGVFDHQNYLAFCLYRRSNIFADCLVSLYLRGYFKDNIYRNNPHSIPKLKRIIEAELKASKFSPL